MMELTDTHCHIQSIGQDIGEEHTRSLWAKAGDVTVEQVLDNAKQAGVTRMICVGCTVPDSELAVNFVQDKDNCWAAIGIHPHEAKNYSDDSDELQKFRELVNKPKVVAIGETGLDYYYNHSLKADQERILRFQLELAKEHNLPLIFHVRDAFDDFWRIFDDYSGVRGVVHSFSADSKVLEAILERDLYVGLNGIMTFTKDLRQLDAAKAIPLQKILLETDAPFLTPNPFRGTMCEPKHVFNVAEFLSSIRGEDIQQLAAATTHNAKELFGIE